MLAPTTFLHACSVLQCSLAVCSSASLSLNFHFHSVSFWSYHINLCIYKSLLFFFCFFGSCFILCLVPMISYYMEFLWQDVWNVSWKNCCLCAVIIDEAGACHPKIIELSYRLSTKSPSSFENVLNIWKFMFPPKCLWFKHARKSSSTKFSLEKWLIHLVYVIVKKSIGVNCDWMNLNILKRVSWILSMHISLVVKNRNSSLSLSLSRLGMLETSGTYFWRHIVHFR